MGKIFSALEKAGSNVKPEKESAPDDAATICDDSDSQDSGQSEEPTQSQSRLANSVLVTAAKPHSPAMDNKNIILTLGEIGFSGSRA